MDRKLYIDKEASLYTVFLNKKRNMYRVYKSKNGVLFDWRSCRMSPCEWRTTEDEAMKDLEGVAKRHGMNCIRWSWASLMELDRQEAL